MKIVYPRVDLINEPDNVKRIEIAGRTCYKSEDKIHSGSAQDFVKRLIRRGHEAMLEHSNIIVRIDNVQLFERYEDEILIYERETGIDSKLRHTWLRDSSGKCRGAISGNARAWRNFARVRRNVGVPLTGVLAFNCDGTIGLDDWIIDESDLTEEERKYHAIRTVRITCDRGVSHELVRHRVFSFAQESTRYCDYSNGDIAFIAPWWYNDSVQSERDIFLHSAVECEENYKRAREIGLQPQAARDLLITALKTEVVMTGTLAMWDGFFGLRCDTAAHPDMRIVAGMTKLLIG